MIGLIRRKREELLCRSPNRSRSRVGRSVIESRFIRTKVIRPAERVYFEEQGR